jgi:phosphoglycolate phosphatase
MKIDTILFDLDGTLLNSLDDLADSVNYALAQCGYPARTIDEVRNFVGSGVARLIALAVPENTPPEDEAKCLAIMKQHYQNNMYNKTCPYDGIKELLTALKARNMKLAVISNKLDAAVKPLCRDWFGEWIELAVGESATIGKKPSPVGVLYALKTLQSPLAAALYVGDSEIDIQTARNACIHSVGVTWGFRSREALESEQADFIIDAPAQLLDVIDSVSLHD